LNATQLEMAEYALNITNQNCEWRSMSCWMLHSQEW